MWFEIKLRARPILKSAARSFDFEIAGMISDQNSTPLSSITALWHLFRNIRLTTKVTKYATAVFLCLSFSCNFIGDFLNKSWNLTGCFVLVFLSHWLGKKVRLRAENSAIREFIALLRANQITRITSWISKRINKCRKRPSKVDTRHSTP